MADMTTMLLCSLLQPLSNSNNRWSALSLNLTVCAIISQIIGRKINVSNFYAMKSSNRITYFVYLALYLQMVPVHIVFGPGLFFSMNLSFLLQTLIQVLSVKF